MSMPQEADSFEFAGYLSVLRRRWWVVLVLACAGIVVAGAYIAVSPKGYTASATVNVTATGISQNQGGGAVAGGRTNSAVNLDTEVQIVQSSSVAAIAARELHSSLTPAALAKNISVAVPANSSVLQISCTARSAQQSADCANAFATAYLHEPQRHRDEHEQRRAGHHQRPAERPGEADRAADHPEPVAAGELAAAGQCPGRAADGGQPAEGPRQPGRRALRFGGSGLRRIDHHQGHAADHPQQPQEEDHPAQRAAGRAAHRPDHRVRLGQAGHADQEPQEPRAARCARAADPVRERPRWSAAGAHPVPGRAGIQ